MSLYLIFEGAPNEKPDRMANTTVGLPSAKEWLIRTGKGPAAIQPAMSNGVPHPGHAHPVLPAEFEDLAPSYAAFKFSRLKDVRWCHPKFTVVVKHLGEAICCAILR